MFKGSRIIRSLWRRLAGNRQGNVALIFGLTMIPIVCAVGVAIDATRAYQVKVRLGAAMDAAALAVGSTTDQNVIAQRLINYFKANYPPGALGQNVTITPVSTPSNPNGNLSASSVTFQAQATVPMTFMSVVGFQPVTVTVTNQIHKSAGLEVVLVLDNTGSMLCGPNDGAPNYSTSLCQGNVVSTDITCTNPSNQSRICTLRNAATQFVNTLIGAISSQQQLLIGVVPYVTTVNVGSLFCSNSTTCSNMATDGCSATGWINEIGSVIANPNPITFTGKLTNGSATVSNLSANANDLYAGAFNPFPLAKGMTVTGNGIPNGTTIADLLPHSGPPYTSLTLSAPATSNTTTAVLTPGFKATSTANSTILTAISSTIGSAQYQMNLQPGMVIGANINVPNTNPNPKVLGVTFPVNVSVKSIDSQTQIHLCQGEQATAAASNSIMTFMSPIPYDTTNTATTANWMGCVVEPTSSDENKNVPGVINSGIADPDTSEPSATMSWYPFWWQAGWNGTSGNIINKWTPGTIVAQTNANPGGEIQGQVTTDWETFNGPNEGCPVPILPLTDVTTTTGKNAVLNTINSMWPRDAGGTQVHIGMTWGWRVISPNTPFTAARGGYTPVSGHPLSYSDAITQGWTKVVVLMTDGTEEWPDANSYTGLGFLSEGKIGTTSSTATAQTNLDTRLQTICQNMADPTKNIVIYTIGLGSDGASNTTLQQCATAYNGGFFEAADTSNLQLVFNDVAQALLALRLAK